MDHFHLLLAHTQERERVCTLVPQLLQLTSSIDITHKSSSILRVKWILYILSCVQKQGSSLQPRRIEFSAVVIATK